jgi:Na+/phosphate symporter
MTHLNFWKKLSQYSTIFCGIIFILLVFFKKHIQDYIFVILPVGIIVLAISLFSEIMKFILKRKSNE